VLVAEAGTGTGKTFAYLVPALLAGGKVIISTGTKTLQDQLFNRDLPTVRAALKVPVGVALLKGRANYVCHYHLERNAWTAASPPREDAADLRAIGASWRSRRPATRPNAPRCPRTRRPGRRHLDARQLPRPGLPAHQGVLRAAGARNAMEADVVVVNHHLFFADVMLRDEGMGELLPACNAVIFDEAHQLPETASLFFGESVSTSQLLELARDTRSETVAAARDCVAIIEATRKLEKAARDLRLVFNAENARFGSAQLEDNKPFHEAMVEPWMRSPTSAVLETQAERSEGLANCLRRTQELQSAWRAGSKPEGTELGALGRGLQPVAGPQRHAPVHRQIFKRQMDGHPRAWVFTSATLAVGKA
jgi:ATP-dependent DNA helicase DinG